MKSQFEPVISPQFVDFGVSRSRALKAQFEGESHLPLDVMTAKCKRYELKSIYFVKMEFCQLNAFAAKITEQIPKAKSIFQLKMFKTTICSPFSL